MSRIQPISEKYTSEILYQQKIRKVFPPSEEKLLGNSQNLIENRIVAISGDLYLVECFFYTPNMNSIISIKNKGTYRILTINYQQIVDVYTQRIEITLSPVLPIGTIATSDIMIIDKNNSTPIYEVLPIPVPRNYGFASWNGKWFTSRLIGSLAGEISLVLVINGVQTPQLITDVISSEISSSFSTPELPFSVSHVNEWFFYT